MSNEVKLSVPTMVIIAAIVGAGAFAAGRATSPAPSASHAVAADPASEAPRAADPGQGAGQLPPGHPPMGGNDMPSGHPPVNGGAELTAAMAAAGRADGGTEGSLSWKAPAKWQAVPSTSTMRLATYRITHLPGDDEDPEMSVMQAGGSVDANVQRWIGQFDAEGQKTAKRTTKKVGNLDVTIVEIEGTFVGGMGMGKDRGEEKNWVLLGAIVATPGMPHFFKLTGPAKTVKASRPEFDALVSSFATK